MKHLDPQDVVRAREKHVLTIPALRADAYALCRDITQWPRFMPAVVRSGIIKPTGPDAIEEVEITARANDELHTWRSARRLNDAEFRVTFIRLDPQPPLLRMTGVWEFDDGEEAGTTLVTLRHSYTVTDETARHFFARAIRANAMKDLEGMRNWFAGVNR